MHYRTSAFCFTFRGEDRKNISTKQEKLPCKLKVKVSIFKVSNKVRPEILIDVDCGFNLYSLRAKIAFVLSGGFHPKCGVPCLYARREVKSIKGFHSNFIMDNIKNLLLMSIF